MKDGHFPLACVHTTHASRQLEYYTVTRSSTKKVWLIWRNYAIRSGHGRPKQETAFIYEMSSEDLAKVIGRVSLNFAGPKSVEQESFYRRVYGLSLDKLMYFKSTVDKVVDDYIQPDLNKLRIRDAALAAV